MQIQQLLTVTVIAFAFINIRIKIVFGYFCHGDFRLIGHRHFHIDNGVTHGFHRKAVICQRTIFDSDFQPSDGRLKAGIVSQTGYLPVSTIKRNFIVCGLHRRTIRYFNIKRTGPFIRRIAKDCRATNIEKVFARVAVGIKTFFVLRVKRISKSEGQLTKGITRLVEFLRTERQQPAQRTGRDQLFRDGNFSGHSSLTNWSRWSSKSFGDAPAPTPVMREIWSLRLAICFE